MENFIEKKYFIITYGCQMNIHESEKIAGVLTELGYSLAQSETEADVIVFNTCCIRESAELKIIAKIGDIKALKKVKKDLLVIVCGCMTQQKGMAENLKKKFPFLNIIIGTHNLEELADIIKFQHGYNAAAKFITVVDELLDTVINRLGV
jgi:tRNA-2-methylthio-N6-dimethylallyladenosine synthase